MFVARGFTVHAEEIQYFNRYTGQVERERIYGEAFMRWTYGTVLGKFALHGVAKRAFFARWYGWRMNRPVSARRVAPFLQTYGLNPAEFAEAPGSFKSFNEFFIRKLKPGARPIDPNPNAAIFPADGRHLGFEDISRIDGIFVKGQKMDLTALLKDVELAKRYERGTIIMSRLCPVDYHRFHFPVAGVPGKARMLNGPLFSVSPIALRQNIRFLWENKRAISRIESADFGTVLMLEIGATNVGSIEYTYVPDEPMQKGAEKGYFKFGGSSMITIFEPGKIRLAPDLVEQSSQHRELYARMGDRMAMRISRN